jgi:hypothetical protein
MKRSKSINPTTDTSNRMGHLESATPIKNTEEGMVTVKDMLRGRKTSLNPTTRNGLNTCKTEKFGNLKQALRNVFDNNEVTVPKKRENSLNSRSLNRF